MSSLQTFQRLHHDQSTEHDAQISLTDPRRASKLTLHRSPVDSNARFRLEARQAQTQARTSSQQGWQCTAIKSQTRGSDSRPSSSASQRGKLSVARRRHMTKSSACSASRSDSSQDFVSVSSDCTRAISRIQTQKAAACCARLSFLSFSSSASRDASCDFLSSSSDWSSEREATHTFEQSIALSDEISFKLVARRCHLFQFLAHLIHFEEQLLLSFLTFFF